MKVAVVGSKGQLGTDLVLAFQEFGHSVSSLSHLDVDVTNQAVLLDSLRCLGSDVVINCAAYVKVDQAEEEADLAFSVNALGALNVARGCAAVGALSIYISTDYVFDGCKDAPYLETDVLRPINVYGASKMAGEYLVQQSCPDNSLIIRVASLFGKAGSSGKGGNFVEAILAKAREGAQLRVVDDIGISPTYTRDAAAVIMRLAESRTTGVVHVTNRVVSPCTWYDLASKAVELCGLEVVVEPIDSKEYVTTAKRPANSALDNFKACELTGQAIPVWEDALEHYLKEKSHID